MSRPACRSIPGNCGVCGAPFLGPFGQKYCCKKCANIASKGKVHVSQKKSRQALIQITTFIENLRADCRPVKGGFYPAERIEGSIRTPEVYIIDVQGKQILIRAKECREVTLRAETKARNCNAK